MISTYTCQSKYVMYPWFSWQKRWGNFGAISDLVLYLSEAGHIHALHIWACAPAICNRNIEHRDKYAMNMLTNMLRIFNTICSDLCWCWHVGCFDSVVIPPTFKMEVWQLAILYEGYRQVIKAHTGPRNRLRKVWIGVVVL